MAERTIVLEEQKEPKREPLFTTFAWSGMTRYRCALCAFDCGSEKGILEHIDEMHLPEAVAYPFAETPEVELTEPRDNVVAVVEITGEMLKTLIEGE